MTIDINVASDNFRHDDRSISYYFDWSRRNGIKTQLTQLGGLSGKSQEAIEQLMQETKEHRTHYQKNLDDFRTSRRMLEDKADKLRRLLDMQQLEKEFEKTRLEMTGNWTTLACRKACERSSSSCESTCARWSRR